MSSIVNQNIHYQWEQNDVENVHCYKYLSDDVGDNFWDERQIKMVDM